jgi:hypothetical protein
MAGPLLGTLGGGREGPKRVLRTGLALVHENEVVYPAAGSAAEAVQAIEDAKGAVQVYFPVHIEIRTIGADGRDASGPDAAAATDALATELARAIDPG